jgi:hypothetical protein
VELGVLVAEALLAGAEGAEVLDRLGDDVVEELEVDAAGLLCRARGQQWFSSGSCTMHVVLESCYRQLQPGAQLGGMAWRGSSPFTGPTLVTLPRWSTVTSGPVQLTSK